ncbi:isoprenylcysteine carboxylmethyltransferase family protein [Litoribacter alkaliphilus]|uniref:Isoprenylcysteine carboxylmethyltransferase family protein n=1 Tax=Litoribacter ruber TaxID=702568 RepID=A0AAP2G4E3_9BACT|nr:isoprenylcysteine carboxylmethyltransferase family protein [Litoribacter alkaliphilus]MBS9524405.1 isoprenylcysteine carboxylmethyltransferase family protein [Litoribacter alkaliphilus]
MPYFFLLLFWAVFYFTHTFFARLKLKRKFQRIMGKAYKWYRFFYTLWSSLLFLAIFLYAASIPAERLFTGTDFTQYLGLMGAGIGTIILIKSFKNFSLWKFSGLVPHDDLEEKQELVVVGIHKHLRHPIYLGLTFIFVGYLLFTPTLASLVHLVALMLYLPVGIYYEEKKLIAIFGEKYKEYQATVPALIPRFTR